MKQLIIGISVLPLATAANADGPLMSTVPAIVKQECAACHIVYPPQFLPKQSWVNILNNLDKHFGTDASLDAKTVKNVSDWIMQDAGTYKRVMNVKKLPTDDRLTTSVWFHQKHDKDVAPEVWKRASIKSPANCIACHSGADTGDYSERGIRIPK